MKIIKIGIASQAEIRQRVLAIAKGELKPMPSLFHVQQWR